MAERGSNKILIFVLTGFFILVIGLAVFLYLKTPTLASNNDDNSCTTILNNGNPEEKIDVVFAFDGVDKGIAKEYIDYLLSVSPFSENPKKFNFYSIDFSPECKIQNSILICYSRDLVKASKACPNDYLIVLSKQSGSTRSSAYLGVISLNIVTTKSVLIHEFSHVFANLADEYVPSTIPRGSLNCASECGNFNNEVDKCYQGCSKDSYYRTVDAGIMRTLGTVEYGDFDKKIVEETLTQYA